MTEQIHRIIKRARETARLIPNTLDPDPEDVQTILAMRVYRLQETIEDNAIKIHDFERFLEKAGHTDDFKEFTQIH